MNRKILKSKKGPEATIQDEIIEFLRIREWLVKSTHGNIFQSGFPDLWCSHSKYGHRWVEVKNPNGFKFEKSQLEFFPQLCAHGSGVWVLVAATLEEYDKLFKAPNWYVYLL